MSKIRGLNKAKSDEEIRGFTSKLIADLEEENTSLKSALNTIIQYADMKTYDESVLQQLIQQAKELL